MDVYYELNDASFVWNDLKAKNNPGKHGGVTFQQAATVFFDPLFRLVDAERKDEARDAIAKPIHDEGAAIDPDAVDLIVSYTHGYPYFLQEWGKHAWDIAKSSPITKADVEAASTEAVAALDESFFRVRFDRLTPTEKRYLRAMAELGPGPHRSGDIAAVLGRDSTSLAPIRSNLIAKGMIWSPTHGDTAFTVPLFDAFMKRIVPGSEWLKVDA